MTTRIQVYTTANVISKKDGYRLVATDGVYGRYLTYDNELPVTWSTELIPTLMDAVTILRSKDTWVLGNKELIDLVYEADIGSHPEFFI